MRVLKILILGILSFPFQIGMSHAQGKYTEILLDLPLDKGENPTASVEGLSIHPVNLFVQSFPLNADSPHIQLQLEVGKGDDSYSTFLWFYETDSVSLVNYPKAFKDHIFSLQKDEQTDTVHLLVEKIDFEKEFFLEQRQEVRIGDLNLHLDYIVNEWTVDGFGNYEDSYSTYMLEVWETDQEKDLLKFMSPNRYEEYVDSLEWKEYKISLLSLSENDIQIKVSKK